MSSNKRLRLSHPSSITSLASTSSSSIQKRFKYDVFLSFRGEDTRKNIVDHLYHALNDKGIYTYKDDEKIQKGKRISDDLLKSIEDSKFYIIVFSKNYASSSWCLEELVKIMECQKMDEHTAYPVFYDVEPTQVRKQSGAVGEAFAKHEKEEAAGKWKEALKEAADLAGWELKNTHDGHEAKFIKKLVEEFSLELRSINSGFDEKLVGMDTRVRDVVSSLEIGIDEVRMIGIKGIGGGGKTTTARAVFDHVSIDFEARVFVENVREVSNGSMSGLKKLQKQILSDVLNQHVTVNVVHDGKNMMKERMRGKRVLLVLDDVDHIEQLEALAGEPNWFKPGSRILITTRDEQVLVAHRVNFIFDVNLLSDNEAIRLFSRHAFGRENPLQGYEELSTKVVRYAAGLPLTVKVLGSFLCGKDKLEWVDAIDRLKIIPLMETLEKLELSYISLEDDYKEIFLDIACILKGRSKKDAIRVLESCGFHARNGLKVLEQRSLITISKDEVLGMHDHIEEMGKNIVRRSQPDEPNKHSRLWIKEEIEDILANDMGTEATRCLKLYTPRGNSRTVMKGLRKMKKLRYLEVNLAWEFISKSDETYLHGDPTFDDLTDCFDVSETDCETDPKFDDTSQYFTDSLKYVKWEGYPFLYFPKTFQANNLVGLEIESGRMVQLWEEGEKKDLKKLKFLSFNKSKFTTFDFRITPNLDTLSLRSSYNLVEFCLPPVSCQKLKHVYISSSKLRTFDLGLTPNLEKLSLESSRDLEELRMPVSCQKLKHVNISSSKLRTFDLGLTPNLERLSLESSRDLEELCMPVSCQKLKHLDISYSKLKTFDLRLTPNLEKLSLESSRNLEELCMPVSCQKLKHLDISYSKLRIFDIGLTPNLEWLSLKNSYNLIELYIPVSCQKLNYLYISHSELRTFDFRLTPNLETLFLYDSHNLVELCMPVSSQKLKHLHISYSKLRTFDLGLTPSLEALSLNYCAHLVELCVSVACPNLKSLSLFGSRLRSLDLELIPNLAMLDLAKCDELVDINAPVGCLKKVVSLNLRDCLRFNDFVFLRFEPSLISRCSAILNLVGQSLDLCPLHPNNNLLKLRFRCFYKEYSSSSVGNVEKLISFGLCACTDFKKFSDMICSFRCLKKLKLKCNIPEFPKDLGLLECLDELHLLSTKIKHFPDSICMLKHLNSLTVDDGDLLEKLPDDLGQLECLEKLYVSSKKIEYLPDSICMLRRLKWLYVRNCCCLGKLPENIVQLESLERLVLSATLIKHPPESVCMLKHLKYFDLDHCALLEKLPEDLGRLECLKELALTDTGISHLPQSIFGLKGLRITASSELLRMYDFPSEIATTTWYEPWSNYSDFEIG